MPMGMELLPKERRQRKDFWEVPRQPVLKDQQGLPKGKPEGWSSQVGKLRQKLEAGELEPQHGPRASGCGGVGGDGLDCRGEQAALAAQTPATGAPREVWGGATCLAAVRGGIGGYLKASAVPRPPTPATFLDMGGGLAYSPQSGSWPVPPILSARDLPIEDQISLLKGATFELCQLRFNTVFNAETGTWECGRLSYCLEDPAGAREEGRSHIRTGGGSWGCRAETGRPANKPSVREG